MSGDSGDSSSDFSEKPSCSRRITRRSKNNAGASCSISSNTGGKKKRRIVMRIEFDDDSEESTSTSSFSDGGGKKENTASTNNFVDDDDDDIKPCSSRKVRGKVGRNSNFAFSSDDDNNTEDDLPVGSIRRRRNFRRNRQRLEDDDDDDNDVDDGGEKDDAAGEGSSNGREIARTTSRNQKNNIINDSEDESVNVAPSTSQANRDDENGFNSDSSSNELLEKCPICLLTFRTQQIGSPATCEHVFCANCIEAWSKNVQTCPIDRIEFDKIIVRESYENRELVREIKVCKTNGTEKLDQDINDEDVTHCEVCNRPDREDVMLLCDSCNQGYHIDCLSPPLEEIPEGSWYCDNCFDSENGDDTDMAEDLNELYEDIRDMGIPETRYRVTEVHQPRILRTRQNERIRAAILSRTRSSTRLLNIDNEVSSSRNASTSRSARTVRNSTRTARTPKTRRRRKRRPRQRTYVVEYDLNNFDEKFAIKTTKRVIKRRRRKRTRRTKRSTRLQVANDPNERKTASKRLAEQLGVKSTDRELRSAASAQSFSLFGNANDLEYFSDSDDGGREQNEIEIETGGGTAVQTSVRISNFRTHRSKKGLLSRLERQTPSSAPDLLSNIMDLQDRWHNASRHMDAVRIGQDGSLNLPPPSAAGMPNPTVSIPPVSTPNATDTQPSTAVNTNAVTQAPMYPRGGGGNNRNFNSGGGGGSGNSGSGGNYNNRYNNQSNYRGGGSGGGAGSGNSGSGQYRSSFGSSSSSSGIVGGNLFNMVGRGNFSFSSQTTNPNQDNDNNTTNNSNNRDRFNQRNNNNNNNNRNNNRLSLPLFNNNNQSNENSPSLNISQQHPQRNLPPPQLPPPPQCPILPVQSVPNIIQSAFPPPPIQQRLPMPMPPPVGLFNNLPPTTGPPPMYGPPNLPLPMLSQPPPIIPMHQPALTPAPVTVSTVVPPLAAPPTFNSSLFQLTADYGNDDDDDSNCPNFSVYSMESLQVAKSDVKTAAASKGDTPKEDDENEDLVQLSDDDEMMGNMNDEIPLPPSDTEKTNTTKDSSKKESELYEPDEPTLESDDESVDQNKAQSNDEHDDEDIESQPSPENDMELDSQDAAENTVTERASSETRHDDDSEVENEEKDEDKDGSTKDAESDDKDERISLSDIKLPEEGPAPEITPAALSLPALKQSQRKGVLELYDDTDWEELNMEKPTAENYRANTPPLVTKSPDNDKVVKKDDEKINEDDGDDEEEGVQGHITEDDKIDEPATPPTASPEKNQSSDEEKEEGEVDGKEQDRSYTPCLDEKNENAEDENDEDGACTPELIVPSKTSDNLNDATKDANTSSDHAGAADTSGIGGMETELISEEDDADKREKNRRAREAKNKEQFKKVSKNTKDRNYRGDKPHHENKFRDRRPRRSRSRTNDKENQGMQFRRFQRGRFRRRELPRYNVRNVVNQQRSFKDRYGRDESRPPRSLSRNRRRRSFSRSNSRSKSRSRSGSQSSSPKRGRRSFSISPTPPRFNANRRQSMSPRRRSHSPTYRSPIRRQSRTPLRMRSRSNTPVRRVNKNPNNKFKRPPPGKRSLSPPPNRARSMSRFTPRLSRSRTPPRHKAKKAKDRKKKKTKKRQAGSKPGKTHGRSPSRGGSAPPPSKRKRRRTPKAKSPTGDQGWSPSPSPPRNYMQYENVSWTPPLMSPAGVSRLRRNDEYNEFSIPSKPPKKKRDKKKKKSEKRRTEISRKEKRRREGQAPSKEVFASGNNILVSVSFNKDANQQQQTTVVTMPPTREEVLGNRPRSSERQITLERRKKKNPRKRKKLDTKPVAIIDLERSPFQVTQEQADVIVLTDSDGGGHDEENLNVSRESANDMMTEMEHHHQREGSSHRTVNSDKTPPLERLEAIMEESYENAIQQQGPKTPPEPPGGIKFNLLNKNKQKVSRNALHDEAELDFDEQHDEQDQEEREPMSQNTNKIGPNTPPDSGPCSPDVYDPFDPTKSPSMSPRSPTPPPDLSHDSVQDNDVPSKHSTEDLRTEPRMPISSGPIVAEKPTLNPVDLVMALINSKANAAQDLSSKTNESQYSTGPTIVNLIDENDKPDENNPNTGITVLSNVILSSGKSQHIPIISSPPLSKASSQMHKPPPKLTNILSGLPGMSNRHNGVGLDDLINNDIESPYSPGSADYEDLFEPPPDANGTKGRRNKRTNKTGDIFENLFGSSSPPPHLRLASSRKQKAVYARNKHKTIVKVTKLPDDHVKVYDDLPNSAVELQVKDKFMRKLNRQERVVEEVKMILKPKFNRKQISKDDYKEIMRRAVPKICHSRSGDINPKKIQNLIEAYVKKFRQKHKKLNIPNTGQVSSAVKCAAYLKKL